MPRIPADPHRPAPLAVPFVDLAARHNEAAAEVERQVLDVLRSGRWIGGPVVTEAERVAAGWLGRGAAVGVASGTDALILALQAIGVGPGDEVIVPALTFFATAGAVTATGASVAIADVTEEGLLDARSAATLVRPATRAVIPVHLFGSRCPDLALGIPAIDDAAQAIGTFPTPTALLTTLSTYPTKTWGSAGDGGFVAGDDPDLLDRVRRLGNHGMTSDLGHQRFGGHAGRASRLDAVQAAVLLGHAGRLEARLQRRRALAQRYDRGLPSSITPLPRTPGSSVQQYNVLVDGPTGDRDRLQEHLKHAGIGTAVYYRRPLYAEPALAGARHASAPVAERLCATILALPIADIDESGVDRVLDALAAWR